MDIVRAIFGLLLCVAGIYVQGRARKRAHLYDYIWGGELWIIGMVMMMTMNV